MSKYKILKDYEQILMIIEDVLGAGVTNNIQLTTLAIQILGNDYLGTFSSDKMPKYIRDNQCFILNTDSSKSLNKSGHWVAFYKINKKIYYYDSFARSTSNLSKYWRNKRRNKRMYNANTIDRDQSYNENSCGSRSLSFLILMKKYGEKVINII